MARLFSIVCRYRGSEGRGRDLTARKSFQALDEDAEDRLEEVYGRVVGQVGDVQEVPVGQPEVVPPLVVCLVGAVTLVGHYHTVEVVEPPFQGRIEDVANKRADDRLHVGVGLRDRVGNAAFQPDRHDAGRRQDLNGSQGGQIADNLPARSL